MKTSCIHPKSFQALQSRLEDTSGYLKHPLWKLRSLSGEQRPTTCFSKILTVSQKIRKIGFFLNFCHSKSQFSWVQIDLKTSSVHPKPLQTLSGRLEDTSRYLQHPFGTLRSLSGEKRLITCFSNILTASQKIRKIGIFSTFVTRKVNLPGFKLIWKRPVCIQNLSWLYKEDEKIILGTFNIHFEPLDRYLWRKVSPRVFEGLTSGQIQTSEGVRGVGGT